MRLLPFALILTVPALAALGAALSGWWTWVVPLYVFLFVPLVDRIVGDELWNPRDELEPAELSRLADRPAYRGLLVLYAVVEIVVTVFVLRAATMATLSVIERVGLVLSLGVANGGVGITVAHEFIHRDGRLERGFGVALLLLVLYPHFRIEHVQGHHAHVGTPDDPATARRGQSVYAFWRQSVVGSLRSAWSIEARRMGRLGTQTLSPRNRMLHYLVLESLIMVALGWVLGAAAVLAFVVQAVVAFSLLEVVNYIEHYGLARRREGDRFERVTTRHSWDSPRRLTNYLLINLQRHADHHVGPQHPYQVLSHTQEAPRLPAGYAEMVLLALVPPLWFRTIDPLIERVVE